MYWFSVFILAVVVIIIDVIVSFNPIRLLLFGIGSVLLTIFIVFIDYQAQTTDYEVWSGSVIDWEHKEEWDEWIPPRESCSTDSNGKQTCRTIPGYWIHHNAENYIKTSDEGWISVNKSPDGKKKFNDSWPNDVGPLKEYWPLNTPTASVHRYENKVNASYSIYKHPDIDLKDYPGLPEYPLKVTNKFDVDRLVGEFENKEALLKVLAAENTRLNSKALNKQVNLIFVNVGKNKTEDYGFALQDYWEGGNKNDFIIAFSTNDKGELTWVLPITWSESEILKINARNYMLEHKDLNNFEQIIADIGTMVEKDFVRKQFADFSYLQIRTSTTAQVFIWIVNIALMVVCAFMSFAEKNNTSFYGRRW